MIIERTAFTRIRFESPQEELQAVALSDLQQANVQNLIAQYSEDRAKLALDFQATDPKEAYILAQQKLLGSIEALQHLLEMSQEAWNILNNRAITRE